MFNEKHIIFLPYSELEENSQKCLTKNLNISSLWWAASKFTKNILSITYDILSVWSAQGIFPKISYQ
jgi:hypothetical protein